jgi:hypothetical protein
MEVLLLFQEACWLKERDLVNIGLQQLASVSFHTFLNSLCRRRGGSHINLVYDFLDNTHHKLETDNTGTQNLLMNNKVTAKNSGKLGSFSHNKKKKKPLFMAGRCTYLTPLYTVFLL